MKRIAVTYENGEVFQHFGHTEQFKVYEVEDEKIVNSEIIGSNGSGQPVPVKVIAKDEKTVTFDANHEMAGKELNFRIELVEVR